MSPAPPAVDAPDIVLAQIRASSRLPTYRHSHAVRFHPYARYGPRRVEILLAQTRAEDQDIDAFQVVPPADATLEPQGPYAAAEEEEGADNLHIALQPEAVQLALPRRRPPFVFLVIELALAVTRKCKVALTYRRPRRQ